MVSVFVTAGSDLGTGIEFIFYAVFYPEFRLAKKHGTEAVSKAYLEYLYSDEGQRIIAKYHYRPSNPAILKETAAQFPNLTLFTVKDLEGDWEKAQKKHFAQGGSFDQIYQPGR